MKKQLLISTLFMLFGVFGIHAQQQQQRISFEHFSESRGDSHEDLLFEIPYSQIVVLNNSLNSTSGFGMTLNLYGNVVVVDHMETMPDGTTQVVLRREDGKDFYGYRPTIRAVLNNNLGNAQNSLQED